MAATGAGVTTGAGAEIAADVVEERGGCIVVAVVVAGVAVVVEVAVAVAAAAEVEALAPPLALAAAAAALAAAEFRAAAMTAAMACNVERDCWVNPDGPVADDEPPCACPPFALAAAINAVASALWPPSLFAVAKDCVRDANMPGFCCKIAANFRLASLI